MCAARGKKVPRPPPGRPPPAPRRDAAGEAAGDDAGDDATPLLVLAEGPAAAAARQRRRQDLAASAAARFLQGAGMAEAAAPCGSCVIMWGKCSTCAASTSPGPGGLQKGKGTPPVKVPKPPPGRPPPAARRDAAGEASGDDAGDAPWLPGRGALKRLGPSMGRIGFEERRPSPAKNPPSGTPLRIITTPLAEIVTSFSRLSRLFRFGGLGVRSHYFCIDAGARFSPGFP